MVLLETLGLDFLLPYQEYVLFLLALVVTLIVIKIVRFSLSMYLKKIASRTKSRLDNMLVSSVKGPVSLGILISGIYLATTYLTLPYMNHINPAFTVISMLYVAFFAIRLVGTVLEWYTQEVAVKTKTKTDEQFLPIFKKVAYGVILLIIFVWMLGQLGIEITTLVATMGIGGIAVALAIQPILANMFAGAHIVLDRPIKIGDYVELESGEKGTVKDIGWRSTKIRNYKNNLVIIPNKKLADGNITNYYSPTKQVGFLVNCGVAYDSDLGKVERVTNQVAKNVLKKYGGVKGFKPIIRFKEFGDSTINFHVIFRVKSYGKKFLLRHEFIKNLKARFDKEDIEIAFPQLDVHMKK